MDLYDPNNPQSCAVPTADALADRLSECQGFRDLCEVDTPSDALKYVIIGHDDKGTPANGDAWTPEQLTRRHFRCLVLHDPEGTAVSARGKQLNDRRLQGTLHLDIKRQLRESEDLNDAYRFFADRVYAIQETQLAEKALEVGRPWLRNVNVTQGPFRNMVKQKVGQGGFFWAIISVEWGRGLA